jgi:hypothetical protein
MVRRAIWAGCIVCLLLVSPAALPADPDACLPGELGAARGGHAPAVEGVAPHGCGKARAAAAYFLAREQIDEDPVGSQIMREAFGATDMLHYDLEIELFTSTASISGTNTMTIQSLVDGLTQFTFRLRNQYTITSATVNGSTPVSVSTTSTTTRTATLDRAYNTGETFTLTIAYNGATVSRGFGSIEFDVHNGSSIVSSLSEPYFSYTWWPCKDGDFGEPGDNADKATIDFAIIAPSTLRSVSNGVLLGVDTLSGSRKRYRWRESYPIATYLVAFCTTNFNTWTVTYDYGAGTMPVEFNIWPENNNASNRTAWEKCLTMLATYEPIFGLYPFIAEKYGIYQFTFGGGMEHQTNTGQGGFWEYVTAHELSHQWWGDGVTCRTWHDIGLNEGFATYAEALWEERKPGSSGLPALHAAMASRRPSSVGDSVYVYDTADFGRIFSSDFSYDKAGWVQHQLRHVVGDTVFFDILAEYRSIYEGSAATYDDFAAVASDVYGQDLTWFFDEWIYQIGAPAYSYGWQTVSINGQNYLRLYIDQTQSASYPLFKMPLDVRVNYSGGNQTYVVFNDADPEHFVIPIPAAATSIVLDEFNWVLNTAKTSTAYVNGPPKVVQAAPAPGALLDSGSAPSQATVTFSENVTCVAGDFVVTEQTSGAVPFTFGYSAANFTATLSFGGPLPAGRYMVTVNDTIRSTAASIVLDGEIADPGEAASLPSGEGLAGGDAVYTFAVGCPGDATGDGVVDNDDLQAILDAWASSTGDPNYDPNADFDSNGTIDNTDLQELLDHWAQSCL